MDSLSLCAQISIALTKCCDLCRKILGPSVGCIDKIILESFWLLDINSHGKFVGGHGVEFCRAYSIIWIRKGQAELRLRETDTTISLMHDPEVVTQAQDVSTSDRVSVKDAHRWHGKGEKSRHQLLEAIDRRLHVVLVVSHPVGQVEACAEVPLAETDGHQDAWSRRGLDLIKYLNILVGTIHVKRKLWFVENDIVERRISDIRQLFLPNLLNYLR